MIKLSGIVIAFNEEKNIAACINSLKSCCDEIIVIDSGSSDRTVEIAKQSGAMVFFNEWQGFGKQKNYAVDMATGEWILSIDADERLSEGLAKEISMAITSNKSELFSFTRRTKVYGQWIKFSGWSNDIVVRLFKNNKYRFTNCDVHEKLEILNEPVLRLDSPLLHFRNDDLESALRRMDQYSTLWARQQYGKKTGYIYFSLIKGIWVFLKIWIFRGDFGW